MVEQIDSNIKKMLSKTNFGTVFLDNCFNSKFLIMEVIDGNIAGVCFVGGALNSNGIEIVENYRGQGLGTKLLNELLDECKKRKISFLTGVFKPTNKISIHTHMKIGYVPLFSVYYNEKEGMEIIVILPFNKKGKFLSKVLKIFNTRPGNFLFVIMFKLLNPFLKNLIAFDENNISPINLSKSIKNFRKVENLDLK